MRFNLLIFVCTFFIFEAGYCNNCNIKKDTSYLLLAYGIKPTSTFFLSCYKGFIVKEELDKKTYFKDTFKFDENLKMYVNKDFVSFSLVRIDSFDYRYSYLSLKGKALNCILNKANKKQLANWYYIRSFRSKSQIISDFENDPNRLRGNKIE